MQLKMATSVLLSLSFFPGKGFVRSFVHRSLEFQRKNSLFLKKRSLVQIGVKQKVPLKYHAQDHNRDLIQLDEMVSFLMLFTVCL